MNITKENFEDSFDVICEAIRTSHFIALDGEFTGKLSFFVFSRCA